MRDAEQTIERLLAGLRDAEPAAGIERRILEALDGMEARGAAASASFWRWPLRPAIATVLACVAILMVALMVQQRRHATTVLRSADVRQPPKPESVARGEPAVHLRARPLAPVRPAQPAPAVRETQTAGFPAPPLPLTEQERLLLRLVHHGDAENMAMLNPNVRASRNAKTTEQFQQFFAIDATEMRSQSE